MPPGGIFGINRIRGDNLFCTKYYNEHNSFIAWNILTWNFIDAFTVIDTFAPGGIFQNFGNPNSENISSLPPSMIGIQIQYQVQNSVAQWLRRSPTNPRSLTAVGSSPGRTTCGKGFFLAVGPYWLARCQYNVTEWHAVLICDIVCQWTSTIKVAISAH